LSVTRGTNLKKSWVFGWDLDGKPEIFWVNF